MKIKINHPTISDIVKIPVNNLNMSITSFIPDKTMIFQSLTISAASFIANIYVAIICLFLYFTTHSCGEFSIMNYNKFIGDEIERQRNPVLSIIGVWMGMLFCLNLCWVVLENLTFPFVILVLWWMLIWCVGFTLGERIKAVYYGKSKKT